ncbi:serine hydrolase domain-containing protein [Nonomuraea thailandensis]
MLIAHRGKTVLTRSYGWADKEGGVRNEADTIYCLASGSKPFTALAIIQLAQAGKLRFTDTVGTLLKGYPQETAGHVTIHHLLTHSSGLQNLVGVEEGQLHNSVEEATAFWNEQRRKPKPQFTPGSQYSYSSLGMQILGEIVTTVSGQPFHEYVKEHIFDPAGMTDSAYYTRNDWTTNKQIAHPFLYQEDGSRIDGIRHLDAVSQWPGSPPNANGGRAFIGNGGGHGFSTAPDLVKFALALDGEKLAKRPYIDLFITPKFPTQPAGGTSPAGLHGFMGYGIIAGISRDERTLGHGGGIAGGNTNWTIYRDRDLMGIFLSNYELDTQAIIDQERKAVFGTA